MSAIAACATDRLVILRPTLVERAALHLAVATERFVARRMERRAVLAERLAAGQATTLEQQRRREDLLRAAALDIGTRLR